MTIAWLIFPTLCVALATVGFLVARLAERAISERAVPVRISERREETPDTTSLFLDVPQPNDARRSRHACSQRRHASAQTMQCSCMSACLEHSSPHASHAVAHASRNARVRFAS